MMAMRIMDAARVSSYVRLNDECKMRPLGLKPILSSALRGAEAPHFHGATRLSSSALKRRSSTVLRAFLPRR
jgi:hypothetical protein